jgi:2-succinyl-6-hydroxy-2,4-cyclohexadiene-1-carboxylate synthase
VDGLAKLASTLAVDLPGHGAERGPSDPTHYRMERVVDHLVRVLDREGVDRADWVGYSMGGRVALGAAVLRPERVRRLVLESASPGLEGEAQRARRRGEDESLARRLEAGGIERFVDFWMARPLFASQAALPGAVREAARRRRLANDPRLLAAVLRGLGTGSQPSFWDRLPEIRAPTLLLTGALDPRFGETARRMARGIPGALHRVVPGAGHAIHLERPGRWLDDVVPFLSGEGGGPA